MSSVQQNIVFTVKFFDTFGNYVPQYDYHGILSAADLSSFENQINAESNQVNVNMDGYTTEPENVTVAASVSYVQQSIAAIGSTNYSGTTESATFAGANPSENVQFDIALPDGTVLTNQVVTFSDYELLAEDPVIASVTNVVSTTDPVTITFAQIQAHFTTQTTPTTTTGSAPTAPLLSEFIIFGANGANWDCELVYPDGTIDNYTLSTTNVQYWIKNAASVTDNTGQFVPVSGSTPAPSSSTGATSSSTSNTVDQTNAQIQQLQQTIASLNSQLAGSTSEQSSLQSQITQLQNTIKSLESSGNTASTEYTTAQEALQSAQSALSTLQSQDATTKQALAESQAQVQTLTTQVEQLLALQNKTNSSLGINTVPKLIAIVSGTSLVLGILAIDPKKKTVAEVIKEKVTGKEEKKHRPYCYKCKKRHDPDHKHVKEGLIKPIKYVKKFNEDELRKLIDEAKSKGHKDEKIDEYIADKFLERKIKAET